MSQRDGFAGGFLAGAIFGGIVGGVVGALVASGRTTGEERLSVNPGEPRPKNKLRQMREEESMEVARRSLEDKIAQLNAAIDDVRTQIGTVNGNVEIEKERSLE